MPKFLNSTPVRLVTLLLAVQVAMLYSSMRPETAPEGRPLAQLPMALGAWRMTQEDVVEPEVLDMLKADDLVNRDYSGPGGLTANLFVAAFHSQRNGKAPHSPKNCLPGSGWQPLDATIIDIDPGTGTPIPVNRYVVSHGEARALVLYWYQSRDRAVASEYKAKFWVIADAIRLNRTDTALVRVLVPVANHDDERSSREAIGFVQSFYSTLRTFLPS